MNTVAVLLANVDLIAGFAIYHNPGIDTGRLRMPTSQLYQEDATGNNNAGGAVSQQRRSFLVNTSWAGAAAIATAMTIAPADTACAAVGTLPELQDTNAVLQGITVRVTDPAQQKQMIAFLQDAFDMDILRGTPDGIDTWLGYGPEQLSAPSDFVIPVSSFKKYGGHASIHVQYDSQSTSMYYRGEGNAPGNNIAYLQVGVPQYRVSQMVKNGGNVLDAYGYVNVVSPSGLPIRGIVGIWPDPIMLCAINCVNVQESKAFYEQLGFVEQAYPYCRPGNGLGQFEPPQPKGSVYLAPSPNSMGVLLLPTKAKKITANPAVQGLNIVYTPAEGSDDSFERLKDPSGLGINFDPVTKFEAVEQSTRVTRAS